MNRHLSLIILLLVAFLPLTSCHDDDPIEKDLLSSVDITYTYTVSEDILEYFNITANYYNAAGEKVGKQMNSPILTITTSATKFPANRPITFTVTRTEKPAPTTSPVWSESIAINVTKHYSPSGNVVNSSKNNSSSYSPLPDKFTDWSNYYIKTMATGYPVTIKADGNIDF